MECMLSCPRDIKFQPVRCMSRVLLLFFTRELSLLFPVGKKKPKTRNHMVETKMIYQYEIMFAMKCFYAKENVQVAINVVCSALCTTGFEPETKRERASDLYIKDTIALENIVKHSLRTYDYNAVYLRLWDSNWRPDN